MFAISKPLVGMTKQKGAAASSPTSSHQSSSSAPSSAGRSSPQIKTEDAFPNNYSGGIAEDQFGSRQAVLDDGMFSKTSTHEFAGKIDAPRTSSFGKMDAYNFKGVLVSEVEDAIAAANTTSIAQYFGGVDVVYKQSHSNNTMITPLFCPCRIVLEGFEDAQIPTVIVCLVLEKGMTYAITAKYNTFKEFKQLNPRNRVIIHNEFTKNNPISMTHDFSEEEILMFSHAISELLNLRLPVDILHGLFVYKIFYQCQSLHHANSIINNCYSMYYLDEIVTLKKKVLLLEASNLRLVSEKEEATEVIDLSDVVKDLKKVVRDAKKKEKEASETILRLQATIDTLEAQVVEEASAVKPRIKKEKSVPKPLKNAVKGKKGKGQQVSEECESADGVSSPEESLPQAAKRKRATKKTRVKEADLSPADESSVEGLIN